MTKHVIEICKEKGKDKQSKQQSGKEKEAESEKALGDEGKKNKSFCSGEERCNEEEAKRKEDLKRRRMAAYDLTNVSFDKIFDLHHQGHSS